MKAAEWYKLNGGKWVVPGKERRTPRTRPERKENPRLTVCRNCESFVDPNGPCEMMRVDVTRGDVTKNMTCVKQWRRALECGGCPNHLF
jgi:hypothetical protein